MHYSGHRLMVWVAYVTTLTYASTNDHWAHWLLLIGFCERVDFIHICAQRKLTFVQHLARFPNDVLSTYVLRFKLSKEFTCLCSDFEVLPTDNLSKGKLRSIVFKKF